ncbi:LOW QUALITY PROTEIN: hypothetical protein CVT26_014491 [Gymnopilus dilepis]|uniref:Uncharacterized protein n=1 Tax=Gymnopilus dilepis TaxID=231916 RepID=A0A409VVE8_9AGAR|nr:LOW QUALITY PROTEIN: hypothetical protein CVT26_014491 [Gymnopilus dilepis]
MAPTFPVELTDQIIDDLAQLPMSKEDRHKALTSLTLVSPAFRRRAHRYLFKDVKLLAGAVSNPTAQRLQTFREILEWPGDAKAQGSEVTSIAPHIKSLTINFNVNVRGFGGRTRRDRYSQGQFEEFRWTSSTFPDENRGLHDGVLVAILDKLFKAGHGHGGHAPPSALSLNAKIKDKFDNGAEYAPHISMVPSDWWSLDDSEDFFATLRGVARNPLLLTLGFSGFKGVPQDLLSNSCTKHLKLSRSEIDLSAGSNEGDEQQGRVGADERYLESLETDLWHTLDSLQSLERGGVAPQNLDAYSRLQEVVLNLSWDDELRTFRDPVDYLAWDRANKLLAKATPSLKKLTLRLVRWSGTSDPVTPHLVLGHLRSVQDLTIYRLTRFPRTNDNLGYTEISRIFKIASILPCKTSASFSVTYPKLFKGDTEDLFEKIDFTLIDEFFSKSDGRFRHLKSLTFMFEISFLDVDGRPKEFFDKNTYDKDARMFLLKSFPKIRECGAFEFDIVVDVRFPLKRSKP